MQSGLSSTGTPAEFPLLPGIRPRLPTDTCFLIYNIYLRREYASGYLFFYPFIRDQPTLVLPGPSGLFSKSPLCREKVLFH